MVNACRSLHSHAENASSEPGGEQVYQQPGLDYSIQRREQVYSHMIHSQLLHISYIIIIVREMNDSV